MVLAIGGVAVPVRDQTGGDVLALFKDIEQAYTLDPEVTKYLVETLKLQDLLDFAHVFDDSKHVQDKVSKMGLGEQAAPLQTARLRRAWHAVRDTAGDAATLKAKCSDDADLDTPLPKPELDRLRACFWRRYHIQLAAHTASSDALLSRIAREFNTRLLTIRPAAQCH